MSEKLFDLAGRVALVTGGSKGIGKEIANAHAAAGAELMIGSRHEDELLAAAGEIADRTGARVLAHVADIAVRAEVTELARAAEQEFGRVDILVNNAGSNVPQRTEDITDEVWDRLLELNLTSCVFSTRALVPGMKARGWGRVIYIASIMGITGSEARAAYCGTKAALIGLTHSQAVELGSDGITVNCISPGPILTDLPRSVLTPEQLQAFASRTAIGRWGETRELAGPALLLASDAGSYITGANLVVDGGCTIKSF